MSQERTWKALPGSKPETTRPPGRRRGGGGQRAWECGEGGVGSTAAEKGEGPAGVKGSLNPKVKFSALLKWKAGRAAMWALTLWPGHHHYFSRPGPGLGDAQVGTLGPFSKGTGKLGGGRGRRQLRGAFVSCPSALLHLPY